MEPYRNRVGTDLEEFARTLQVRMKERYGCGKTARYPVQIQMIAGADVAYTGEYGIGVVVLLSYPSLELLSHVYTKRQVLFPYIPGLFAFRELPLIMAAFEKINKLPDLLVINGHGYAHPRRFGYACHAGALLGIPTIGVAFRLLSGKSEDPDRSRGSCAPLTDRDEIVGMSVRTREGSRPVYVSAGYRTELSFAVEVTLTTTRDRRIPVPLHAADLLAREYRRKSLWSGEGWNEQGE